METMDLETDVCRSRDLSLHLVPYKLKVLTLLMLILLIMIMLILMLMTLVPSLTQRLCTCAPNYQGWQRSTPSIRFVIYTIYDETFPRI